jgi:hypothetical protein
MGSRSRLSQTVPEGDYRVLGIAAVADENAVHRALKIVFFAR